MEQKIQQLIDETERWRTAHKAAGRNIDAAFCAIRIDAFKDVLKVIKDAEISQ